MKQAFTEMKKTGGTHFMGKLEAQFHAVWAEETKQSQGRGVGDRQSKTLGERNE